MFTANEKSVLSEATDTFARPQNVLEHPGQEFRG